MIATAAVAAVTTAPAAQADEVTDAFLGALNNAGVDYSDASIAESLGQSVCPLLKEPGGNFARTVSKVGSTEGISPDTAAMFTTIAISTYCPSMTTSLINGDWWNWFSNLDAGG